MRKHLRYLSYVVRHKWFVFLAGLQTGAPLWRLVIHDWSKFLPSEWLPYTDYFYGLRFSVGALVTVNSPEGFGGEAQVLFVRQGDASRYVIMPGKPAFWAWNYEIVGLPEHIAAFDRAWLHHQHANSHHWQHWVLREDSGATKALEMPEHFVREMVADWMGAGRAITGRWGALEWYLKNREKILLHTDTEALVLCLLKAPAAAVRPTASTAA